MFLQTDISQWLFQFLGFMTVATLLEFEKETGAQLNIGMTGMECNTQPIPQTNITLVLFGELISILDIHALHNCLYQIKPASMLILYCHWEPNFLCTNYHQM